MLEHHAKAFARDLVRRQASDALALEDDVARCRALDPHDRFHRGRFAGAVRADQAENLAGMHMEVEVLHRREAAEAFRQPADFEDWRVVGGRIHYWRPSCDRAAPRKPPGKNSTTSNATAETMKVASSPVGRKNSPATIRKIAPSAAPSTVRRPPSTAATITFTPTAISTTVPTEAVPK